jgi:ribosomal-protein-alanine N-acetyltransferase
MRLQPLAQGDADAIEALTRDPDVGRFTPMPANAPRGFGAEWIGRYERGWTEGTSAGFAIRDAGTGAFLGIAVVVNVDKTALKAELGYAVSPAARGRGLALRAINLLTGWCFGELAMHRLEMRIDHRNAPSLRVAAQAGYRREGLVDDLELWSRLAAPGS